MSLLEVRTGRSLCWWVTLLVPLIALVATSSPVLAQTPSGAGSGDTPAGQGLSNEREVEELLDEAITRQLENHKMPGAEDAASPDRPVIETRRKEFTMSKASPPPPLMGNRIGGRDAGA